MFKLINDRLIRWPGYAWIVWGLGAAFFFSEYFARVAPSVMVPDLMHAFHTGAAGLGALSGFFYYAYVGMQIPVGALVDRYGAHSLLMITTGLCGLGSFMFASASSLYFAEIGRFLMGFGAAFAFVGTLKLATVWFPPSRLGLLAGLTQALGMLGAAVGQAPMSWSVSQIGWRPTMLWVGAELVILALLIGFLVRDHPHAETATDNKVHSMNELWNGLKQVLRNRQTWINGAYAGLIYAPTAAFAELWGVDYYEHTFHFTPAQAAFAVGLIFIGFGVGGPVSGWISDKMGERKPLLYISALGSLVTMLLALYLNIPYWLVCILLTLYGIMNTGLVTAYAVAGEINPRSVSGMSIAFANMTSVLIGALFLPIIGWILELQWDHTMVDGIPHYSPQAYKLAMLTLPGCLVLAFILGFYVEETYCKRTEQSH